MSQPPVPGSYEDLLHAVSELTRQWEIAIHSLRALAEEVQALRGAYAELSDHCGVLAESLWTERGQSARLELELEWFRALASSRAERQTRNTPVEGIPPDDDV